MLKTKYIIRNLKKNSILHMVMVFQMTFLFCLVFFGVYVIYSKYRFYSSFVLDFKESGMQVEFENVTDKGAPILQSERLKELLSGVEKISSTYRLWATCENQDVNAFAYDEDIIRAFTPEIASGTWLSKAKKAEYIPVVVSHNQYGWNAGDILELQAEQLEEGVDSYKLKIVGVLEENTSVFMKSPNSYENNFYDLFWNYNDSYEQKPLLLFREQDIRDTDIFYIMNGTMMINMKDKELLYQQNLQKLYEIGEISHVTNYTSLYKESKKVIWRDVKVYVPIIIMLGVIAFISVTYITELCVNSYMPEYIVFFQNGMSVKQGRFIATMSQLITMLSAYCISIGIAIVYMYKLKIHTSRYLLFGSVINIGFIIIAGVLAYMKVVWLCNKKSLSALIRRDQL